MKKRDIFRKKEAMLIISCLTCGIAALVSFMGVQLFSDCYQEGYVPKYENFGYGFVNSECPIQEFRFMGYSYED